MGFLITITCTLQNCNALLFGALDYQKLIVFNKQLRFFGKYCLWLLILLSEPLSAELGSLRVKNISFDEGLSQVAITSIVQDDKGFMWFGTRDGLNRYDGYNFKIYRPEPNNKSSISGNGVWALLIDKNDVLWVGTHIGLNKFDPKTNQFTRYQSDPKNPHTLSHNNVQSLFQDKEGNIWVGTKGGGLNYFDKTNESFVHYQNNPNDLSTISHNIINAIEEDSAGNIWVGTHKGLNRFNREQNNFEHISFNNDTLKNANILSLKEDGHGWLWIGTEDNGAFVFNRKNKLLNNFKHISSDINSISENKIQVIYLDSKKRLWLGTYSKGLNLYNYEKSTFTNYLHNPKDEYSLSGDNIFSIYEDRSGVIWVGTLLNGISRFDPYNFSLTLKSNHHSNEQQDYLNNIRSFVVDRNGALWIGSEILGLSRVNPDGSVDRFMHNPNKRNSLRANGVYSLFEDRDGLLWVGTDDGWLSNYNPRSNAFKHYHLQENKIANFEHGTIRAIHEDRWGNLWVGDVGGGAHIFNRKTKMFKHFHNHPAEPGSLSDNRVFSIYEDRLGNIWIVTYGGGLNIYDRYNHTFSHIKHNPKNKNSLIYDFVITMLQDSKGIYWFGTDGQGLNRYDRRTNTFTYYGKDEGLPNNTIYAILEDDHGYLWMTHNKGLSRFDSDKEVFKNYDSGDGIQNGEFNGGSYYKDATGKLYFGGIAGYNAFYGDEIIENPYPPMVVITDFQLFNESIKIGDMRNKRIILHQDITETQSITLSHEDYVFSLQFAALDFVLPSKNQFAYKLEGFEEDWNHANDRRYATYTSLPAGEYELKVKASNNHGVWNEQSTKLKIKVLPPLWQTWWFRMLLLMIAGIIIFLIYAWCLRSVNSHNRQLKQAIEIQTGELQVMTDELQKLKNNSEENLQELNATKIALFETAYKESLTDTASNVLHNVGNLLNNVITSAGLIKDKASQPIYKKFFHGNEILKTHLDEIENFFAQGEKAKQLAMYYIELEKPFQEENNLLNENINQLLSKIREIKEVIIHQQENTKTQGDIEDISLLELVEKSILMQSGSINRHEIEVKKIFDKNLPLVKAKKSILIQVLMGLYKNAKESMDENQQQKNILTLEIRHDNDNAYIKITDTGIGIEKNKLKQIFSCGFSSKTESQGLSLYNCANYMAHIGGDMWAESKGVGQGATIILMFPVKNKESRDDNIMSIKRAC